MADQDAVLVDQRHDVGHGAQRGQTHRLDKKILHSRADAFGPAGLLAQGPGQFHGHARAAQSAEGIIAAGQTRMDDGRGRGQPRARLVMVGDDQLDAQLAGQLGFVATADAAIDGHQHLGLFGGQLRRASQFSP